MRNNINFYILCTGTRVNKYKLKYALITYYVLVCVLFYMNVVKIRFFLENIWSLWAT